MDERLIEQAEAIVKKIQRKQEELYPFLKEAAAIQESIERNLKRTRTRIRTDWVIFENASNGRKTQARYAEAKQMEARGKGRIVQEFEPQYENHWEVEKKPPIVADLEKIHLGEPVTFYGRRSDFFQAIDRKIGLESPLITLVAYQTLTEDDLRKYMEANDEEEKTNKEKTGKGKHDDAGQARSDR
jgi:hypothetical protein